MSDTITLYLWEVDLLYALMCQRFKDYCKQKNVKYPKGDTKITGLSKPPKKDEKETEAQRQKRMNAPSLCKMISEDDAVKKYLDVYNLNVARLPGNEGKKHIAAWRIYQLPEELAKSSNHFQPVVLSDIYCHVFFLFLGYNNVEEFRAGAYVQNHFTCFYYSLEKNAICNFCLIMFFIRGELELKLGDKIKATLSGLDEIDSINELHGTIDVKRDSWNVQFASNYLCLSLSIHSSSSQQGKDQLPDANFFYGFMTGTDKKGRLFETEIIMAKDVPNGDDVLKIHRYLNLRRNYASLNMTEDNMQSVDKLQINNIPIYRIEHYADKTYRLLTSTPAGAVLQSKFTIASDYSSTICVPGIEMGKPLQCRLSLSNISEERLVVFAYRETFVLYTINSIEFSVSPPIKKILKGAFCVADGSVTKNLIGNKFVMSEDNSDFEPQLFKPKDVKQLRKNKIAADLLKELFKENKKKVGVKNLARNKT